MSRWKASGESSVTNFSEISMNDASPPEWVPKVHPLARDATTDDPLELMAEPVPGGDPLAMLECILQEFAWLGYSADQLTALFHHPGYPVLSQLREHLGDEAVKRCVDDLTSRWGVLRFRETIVEEEPPAEPELVQLTIFDVRD